MPGGLLEAAHAAVCVPCAVEGAMAGAAYPAWPASLGAGALQRPWTPAGGAVNVAWRVKNVCNGHVMSLAGLINEDFEALRSCMP
eukprot:scaffold53745_cov23-Tisochrysis_lutea.AAC.3